MSGRSGWSEGSQPRGILLWAALSGTQCSTVQGESVWQNTRGARRASDHGRRMEHLCRFMVYGCKLALVSDQALRRHRPKAGAGCVSSASPDLCGGHRETGVPTATLLEASKWMSETSPMLEIRSTGPEAVCIINGCPKLPSSVARGLHSINSTQTFPDFSYWVPQICHSGLFSGGASGLLSSSTVSWAESEDRSGGKGDSDADNNSRMNCRFALKFS